MTPQISTHRHGLNLRALQRYQRTVNSLKALVLKKDSDLVALVKLLVVAELISKILRALT
jgi:hypothetical protein